MPFNNKIRIPKPGMNKFNLSHEKLLTNNMGELTPNLCELVNPGDFWHLSSTSKTYLQSMIGTTMGSFRVYQFYHFVPLRLIWKNFTQFITGGEDGNDATPRPYINSGLDGWSAGSLMDYLGYVTNYYNDDNSEHKVPNKNGSALPVRAYNQVINDWFINQNIDGMVRDISLDDGLDTTTDTSLFKYVWKPDYFVNALPWAQRGQPISIQLGETAQVMGNGLSLGLTDGVTGQGLFTTNDGGHWHINSATSSFNKTIPSTESDPTGGTSVGARLGVTKNGNASGLVADISNVSGITINALRDAISMQVFGEVSALTGARYIEYLLGMWGVRSSDKTLQRSQYLGGGVAPIYISEVAQTSATDTSDTPQGNLTSNGIAVNTAWGFKHRFEEFGILLGTFVIMPDAFYYQGQRRWLDYDSRWDYPNPFFAHLGEQEVLESEIYAQGEGNSTQVGDITVSDSTKFGFVPRFDECRYIPSSIHGEFKTSLKHLTAARHFNNPPMLNSSFMQGTPSKRIFAVTTQDYDSCKTEVAFNIKCYRKLPKYGNPTSFGLMYGIGGF